jgi:hypothetical protein
VADQLTWTDVRDWLENQGGKRADVFVQAGDAPLAVLCGQLRQTEIIKAEGDEILVVPVLGDAPMQRISVSRRLFDSARADREILDVEFKGGGELRISVPENEPHVHPGAPLEVPEHVPPEWEGEQ